MTTPEQFAEEMRDLQRGDGLAPDDYEHSHACMDELMCKVLRELGYGEGVAVFASSEKWYG